MNTTINDFEEDLDINFKYYVLQEKLKDCEDTLQIEKLITQKSKEYIYVLESKLEEQKDLRIKYDDLINQKTRLDKQLYINSEKYEELLREYNKLEKELSSLKSQNEKLILEKDMYKNSKSWKITKPFRFIKNKLF